MLLALSVSVAVPNWLIMLPFGILLLAIGVLTVNLIGDSVNALLRHDPRTLIGLPIGGLMIWYLLKKRRARDVNAQNPNM